MKLPLDHDDDLPAGHLLSRREALALMGGAGVMLLTGCGLDQAPAGRATTPSAPTSSATSAGCVVRPAETEGPYFVDEHLNRSDIRTDPSDGSVKAGLPLRLAFLISRVNACAPLAGATVDIWQCDALGVYSDVTDPGFNTKGKKFLRGYQMTDASGTARFTTIYPGWYQGRTVHIHFKIRSPSGSGSTYEFTSQLYFDDTITDQVHAQPPYASKGQRAVRNAEDSIFQSSGGIQLLLKLTKAAEGYSATFPVGLQIA
jgi:protocatechuate 3,4-dioxygenase beta subunit